MRNGIRPGAVLATAIGACGCLVATAAAQVTIPGTGGFSRTVAAPASRPAAFPQSPWVKGHNSAVRMIGGALPAADGSQRLLAGIEISLADGWKTYWRHPGDDGGLPPSFNWQLSRNLKGARVLYPMPERIKSLNGTTIGYAKSVVLPIEITPLDDKQPVELAVDLEYGICKEICVPVEAKLALSLEPGLAAMAPDLAAHLSRVPQRLTAEAAGRVLKSAKLTLKGATPNIMFEIAASPAGGKGDLLVEPPAGIEFPVPSLVGDGSGAARRYQIDLKGVEERAKLVGQTLRLTVLGASGAHELDWIAR